MGQCRLNDYVPRVIRLQFMSVRIGVAMTIAINFVLRGHEPMAVDILDVCNTNANTFVRIRNACALQLAVTAQKSKIL